MEEIQSLSEHIDSQFKSLFRSNIEIVAIKEDGSQTILGSGIFVVHRITPGFIEFVMHEAKPIHVPYPFDITTTPQGLEFNYSLDLLIPSGKNRSAFVSRHTRHSHKLLNQKLIIKTV